MSMPDGRRHGGLRGGLGVVRRCGWLCGWLCGFAALAVVPSQAAPPGPVADGPRLGRPLAPDAAARASWNVFPDGRGLPAGRGVAAEGARLFAERCAACHGARGGGGSAEELAGGSEPLTSAYPDKTIGLYWPYATTLFDVVRRSMPMGAPGSLEPDEVYALTAYLLFENGVIAAADEMNPATLAKVRMPNRDGFVGVDAALPR